MTTTQIAPHRIEEGYWIYSAWKHLRSYTIQAAAAFEATVLAGKICDLLGRMRRLAPYSMARLSPIARDAMINRHELENIVIPVLENLGVIQVDRVGTRIRGLRAVVLSQDDVMDQTARIWDHLALDLPERGAIFLLALTAALPTTREEAKEKCISRNLTEQEAEQAIELSLAHNLIKICHVADYDTDFLYNDFLWGEDIQRTVRALAALSGEIREGLRSLLEELHSHEGRPTREIEAARPDLVRLAIAKGLIEAVDIVTAEGKKATFHFTPRFRGFGVSQEQAPDALDQVKLVIASFAFSTRFARYKLKDPEIFLDRLIEQGYAGNASPIGTDYGALERQRIVDVERILPGSDRYRFRALKVDTLVEARDTMKAGALFVPNPRGSDGSSLFEPHSFNDPVAVRQQAQARQAGQRPLYDATLLAAIRNAAQQDTF
ncbi:MAG: hypothetical protein MUP15_00460 [Dehalococcoidia bacterium]|nr:hypothetical protein [Dehalococcoidia bacterium]